MPPGVLRCFPIDPGKGMVVLSILVLLPIVAVISLLQLLAYATAKKDVKRYKAMAKVFGLVWLIFFVLWLIVTVLLYFVYHDPEC